MDNGGNIRGNINSTIDTIQLLNPIFLKGVSFTVRGGSFIPEGVSFSRRGGKFLLKGVRFIPEGGKFSKHEKKQPIFYIDCLGM